ncbi:MAG: response regulator [Acetobacteraceae bacterium]|nr:response regulator [Acetobacteraceae bacterium]
MPTACCCAIPLLPNRALAPDAGGPAPQAQGAAAPRLCILLAEDNPINQLIARRMLERLGHCVHLASNGLEAVEAARQQRFDAILMDMMMPEMDGVTASRAIRSELAGRQVPIVAVTANASDEDHAACLEAGMIGFLAKPFNRATLCAALDAALAEATQAPTGDAPPMAEPEAEPAQASRGATSAM